MDNNQRTPHPNTRLTSDAFWWPTTIRQFCGWSQRFWKKKTTASWLARDGREAYKILQSDQNFTAAIFDVVMPHISGPELVRFMKTEKRLMKIPVMMMTAEQDPKLSSDSFAAGAVVFLPKPFTTAQLHIMLQMLIGKANS